MRTQLFVVLLLAFVVSAAQAASVDDYQSRVAKWGQAGCQKAVAEGWVQGDENGNAAWDRPCTTVRVVHIAGAAAEGESMKLADAFGQELGKTNARVEALETKLGAGAGAPPLGGGTQHPTAPTTPPAGGATPPAAGTTPSGAPPAETTPPAAGTAPTESAPTAPPTQQSMLGGLVPQGWSPLQFCGTAAFCAALVIGVVWYQRRRRYVPNPSRV